MITRRAHLQSLFGVVSTVAMPLLARAQDKPIPAEGIGNRIKHLSYSDVGGRPDGVQVMVNRGHVYYGHMFSDGVTILDTSDPRSLKPVGFFTAGQFTRTHHLQVADDMMLLANGANIVAMQSYDNQRGTRSSTASPTARNSAQASPSTTSRSRLRCARSHFS